MAKGKSIDKKNSAASAKKNEPSPAAKPARKTGKRQGRKPAKAKAAKKKAVRYSDAEKERILRFVNEFDQENGRGGQSAAAEKFGVTALSISKWRTEKGKVAKVKQKNAPRRKPRTEAGANTRATLERMLALQEKIEALQQEYDSLKGHV